MITGDRDVFHALYLTIIILTTVGMEGPATEADRIVSLVLMVTGVGTVLYATGQMVAFLVEGHFKQIIGRHKVTSQIKSLKDHYIVVGYGRMGQALCSTLAYRGKPFVLIEENAHVLRDAEEKGYLCIEGNAMHDAILEEAGIRCAQGLATCLSNDADNVLITLTARGINPDMMIMARCDEAETESKLRRAGADRVICPSVIGATLASNQLLNPRVDDMIELDGYWPDMELSRISLHQFKNLKTCRLCEIYQIIDDETLVVALIKSDGTKVFRPNPDTTVEPNDQLIVVGGVGSVNRLINILTDRMAA